MPKIFDISRPELENLVRTAVGEVVDGSALPANANWLPDLQNLLEDLGLPLEHFVEASVVLRSGGVLVPKFTPARSRLRVESYNHIQPVTWVSVREIIEEAKNAFKEHCWNALA